jgi:hypothetical protein
VRELVSTYLQVLNGIQGALDVRYLFFKVFSLVSKSTLQELEFSVSKFGRESKYLYSLLSCSKVASVDSCVDMYFSTSS